MTNTPDTPDTAATPEQIAEQRAREKRWGKEVTQALWRGQPPAPALARLVERGEITIHSAQAARYLQDILREAEHDHVALSKAKRNGRMGMPFLG